MADVFLATDSRDASQVVVKILRHPEPLEPQTRASFEREAQVASQLRHPCIGPVLEIGSVHGTPYLVQPYVAGISLAQWILGRSSGSMSSVPPRSNWCLAGSRETAGRCMRRSTHGSSIVT